MNTPHPFAPSSPPLILAILGWGGLFLLIFYTLPTVGPRWLFFFLLVLAPHRHRPPAAAFLNHRFSSLPRPPPRHRPPEPWLASSAPLTWLQLRALPSPSPCCSPSAALIEFLLRLSSAPNGNRRNLEKPHRHTVRKETPKFVNIRATVDKSFKKLKS
jgi:hypothetical protein